ncbi:GNAT family N-acetyltransferase [Patescibacteria group bacterium]
MKNTNNHKTKERLFIHKLDSQFSQKDLIDLVEVCNQPVIYDVLFKEKLNNKTYEKKHAKEFEEYGNSGWKNNENFVFIIRNTDKKIIGGMDIKSAPPESAEIGYWADTNHSGFMTNAVKEMVSWAKSKGFESLYALIVPTNTKSQSLLKRVEFEYVGKTKERGKNYLKYEKRL